MSDIQLSVTERLAHSTVRIECLRGDGGTSIGTGYFFQFPRDNGQQLPLIVTNKHVVRGAAISRFLLHAATEAGMPARGQSVSVSISESDQSWVQHPDKNIDLMLPACPLVRSFDLPTRWGSACSTCHSDRTLSQASKTCRV